MIGAFLLPFPFRGYPAPHLFVFYRFLTSLDEPALFILSDDYLSPPEAWRAQARWEMGEINQRRLGYRVPSSDVIQRHQYRICDQALFRALLRVNDDNPVAAFRQMLTERIPQLEQRFSEFLDDFTDGEIEAIVTWCNCPSLNAAGMSRGIPIINLELGPLRWPEYRSTAYLDFTGVNGNTEAQRRFDASSFAFDGSIDRLRRFFVINEDRPRPNSGGAVGLALQVEDDSNLIAFGHGFDNQSLIAFAHLRFPNREVLVRPHPGSLFDMKDGWFKVDRSGSSIDFIRRCSQILTVNSSVGLEALLQGVPVTALGDCSYSFVARAQTEAELVSRMAYYLFAYLVPMDSIFDARYLRLRLTMPHDNVIVARHLNEYLGTASAGCFVDESMPSESIARALQLAGRPDQ